MSPRNSIKFAHPHSHVSNAVQLAKISLVGKLPSHGTSQNEGKGWKGKGESRKEKKYQKCEIRKEEHTFRGKRRIMVTLQVASFEGNLARNGIVRGSRSTKFLRFVATSMHCSRRFVCFSVSWCWWLVWLFGGGVFVSMAACCCCCRRRKSETKPL